MMDTIAYLKHYTIQYESEYGMYVVRFNGRKVGQAPTESTARSIRRNHHRQNCSGC